MNIAIPTFQFKQGGGLTYLANIVPEMARQSPHDSFHLFMPPRHKDLIRDDNAMPRNIRRVTYNIPFGLLGRVFFEQCVLPWVLKQHQIDVLFSVGDVTTLLAPCPVVLAVRNPNPYYNEVHWGLLQRSKLLILRMLTRWSIAKARATFFVSDASRERVKKVLHSKHNSLHTIYHGLNHQLFHAGKHANLKKFLQYQPFILSVSTINPHKNFELLIDAMAILTQSEAKKISQPRDAISKPIHTLIVGAAASPTYAAHLQEKIMQRNLTDRILLVGPVAYSELPALYQMADVFVLPSLIETFGHPLVEAMACGTPVIATNTTSTPEILGGAGLLCEPYDPQDLATKLATVLDDNVVRKRLREHGLKRAAYFSWEKTARQTLSLIHNAVTKHTS